MATKKKRFDYSEFGEKYQKEEADKKGFTKDERFFKPVLKDGVCAVQFRFIPAPDGTQFIKYQDHSFDYTTATGKKRYWKKCINTFGKCDCPVCAKSWELHESSFKKDNELGLTYCRKEHYISNIYVIKHAARPEDEGKVFLYDFAPVKGQYMSKAFPSEVDKQAPDFVQFYPCDEYEGADFYLTSVKQGEFSNGTAIPQYKASRFLPQSAFLGGVEKKIDEVFAMAHSLDEFMDKSTYPTNEEVVSILGSAILGIASNSDDTVDTGTTDNIFDPTDDVPFYPSPSSSSEASVDDLDDDWFKENIPS